MRKRVSSSRSCLLSIACLASCPCIDCIVQCSDQPAVATSLACRLGHRLDIVLHDIDVQISLMENDDFPDVHMSAPEPEKEEDKPVEVRRLCILRL